MKQYQKEITQNRLHSCRERMGFTQSAVAAIIGCSISSIDRWEKGAGLPNIDNLLSICALYKIIPEQVYPALYKKLRDELNATKEKLKA